MLQKCTKFLKKYGSLLAITVIAVSLFGCIEIGKHTTAPPTHQTAASAGEVEKPGAAQVAVVGSDRTKPGFGWNYGDWSSRIAWEARYALSRSANGSSAWPVNPDKYGPRWLGDWNYVDSDGYARDQAIEEATDVGPLGDTSDGHHLGGWCTFFVRLILYRATYWSGHGVHMTTPGFNGGVYSWCDGVHMTQNYWQAQPGWIIASKDYHMGILDTRATVNGVVGWWIIDANWVGSESSYHYYIGRHFFPDTTLKTLGFWTWYPSWATTN